MAEAHPQVDLFDSIRLFYEDLEELLMVMAGTWDKNDSEMLTSKIDEEGHYGSLDQMRIEAGTDLKYIKLCSLGVEVELKKTPRILTIHTKGENERQELSFFRVKEFFERHQHPVRKKIQIVFAITTAIFLAVLGFKIDRIYGVPIKEWKAMVALSGVVLYVAAWGFFYETSGYFITLKRRHEVKSFFRRNHDELILGLFWTILALVLGSIAAALHIAH